MGKLRIIPNERFLTHILCFRKDFFTLGKRVRGGSDRTHIETRRALGTGRKSGSRHIGHGNGGRQG